MNLAGANLDKQVRSSAELSASFAVSLPARGIESLFSPSQLTADGGDVEFAFHVGSPGATSRRL
jgi:hypothetical protein